MVWADGKTESVGERLVSRNLVEIGHPVKLFGILLEIYWNKQGSVSSLAHRCELLIKTFLVLKAEQFCNLSVPVVKIKNHAKNTGHIVKTYVYRHAHRA